jgi:hypothetical protein
MGAPSTLTSARLSGVRKQYHFWPGESRFDAWDVDRLIMLTADLPVHEVALDSVWEIDTDYWFEPGPGQPTVRRIVDHMRLVHEVDTSFPIILGADWRVMDGMHRVARALLESRTSIDAVQFTMQPDPDYKDCLPDELPY